MKKLIIVLLLAFLAYALYYFIFRKKTKTGKKESGLSQKAEEARVQSQLLKQQLADETSDLKDTVDAVRENALRKEEKSEEKKQGSSLLREDLAEQVVESRNKTEPVFADVKHGLQDSAEDMQIRPELFDEGLAQKAAAVKEETAAMSSKTEDKITLQFGNTLIQNELKKEEDPGNSLLREDLAEQLLKEKEELAAKTEETENVIEESKNTLLNLEEAVEADLDNKSFDVLQHFTDAQEQEELLKDDIEEIEKEKVVVKKFVRKEHE